MKNKTVFGLPANIQKANIWKMYKPYKVGFFKGIFFLIITNFIALFLPKIINETVSLIENDKNTNLLIGGIFRLQTGSLNLLIAIIFVSALIIAIVRTLSRVEIFNIGRQIERDLRKKLFSHLSILSLSFFQQRSIGDLISHLVNDVRNVRLLAGLAVLNILNTAIVFFVSIPAILAIDFVVGISVLTPFFLVVVIAKLLAKKMFYKVKARQQALSQLSSNVQENLSAAQIVKVFHQEKKEIDKFNLVNKHLFKSSMDLAKVRTILFPLMGIMSGLGVFFSLPIGGQAVLQGRMTVGDVVEVNIRIMQIAWPALALGFVIAAYQTGQASLIRINEIINIKPSIVDGDVASKFNGNVRLNNLYVKKKDKNLLLKINLTVNQGDFVGIVGSTGSGKTTIANVLSRSIMIDDNMLYFDNIDANRWKLNSLLKNIAIVSQEPFLFSATLRENIIFANPNAKEEEVDKVISLVGLNGDISRLPKGLDTVVGERGIMLSGGQRQRVALACALLSKPRLLILDDALSAIDSQMEEHIVSSLIKYFNEINKSANKTSIIMITHRLLSMPLTNHIIVMDEGTIIQQGKHKSLLEEEGLYRALWGTSQLKQHLEE